MAVLPPIAAVAPTAPVAPVEGPAAAHGTHQASAFDAALRDALGAGDRAVGAVLSRLEGFQSHAAHLGASQPVQAAERASGPDGGAKAAGQDHRAAMGVMLETYEFAIEAEIVSRAATTLTSSVNTLIKTQ